MCQVSIEARKILRQCEERFYKDFGKTLKIDEIVVSNKMTSTWGLATIDRARNKRIIKLSAKVFHDRVYTEAFHNTVIHEFCHHADSVMFNGWGHGNTWAMLMKHFGLDPNRCVTAKENKEIGKVIPKRVMPKYPYKCSCSEHHVGGKIHNRILQGHTYRCNKCKTYITPIF